MKTSSCDALIIGGGPVGLTLACELLRHGVTCRIVDKNEAPQPWSKAAAVAARTMEVFQDMGIIDRVLERGRPVYGANLMRGTERIARLSIAVPTTPFPYIFGMSQRETELLLAERLVELGGKLERPVELASFAQTDDEVTATLRHPDGSEETVTTPWLIGCDGAHSTVRHTLDLPFEGSAFEQTLVQADIRVKLPFDSDPSEAVMFISDAGPLGMLPVLADGRYRVIAMAPPNPDEEPTLETFQRLARDRAPDGVELFDPNWIVKFRFHGRIVPNYRVGRVFLAGDAGHIHSPVGGQGMNLGIQDAYNLAWKLALVLKGAASGDLLDSYDAERHPIGKSVVDVTDRATKGALRMLALRMPLAAALRAQAMSFLMSTGVFTNFVSRAIGGMNVGYPTSPIVGEHHISMWKSEVGSAETERPSPGDWRRFNAGPGPGERVADADVGEDTTLFDMLRGTKHQLWLFDGAKTDAGYDQFATIADRVTRRYGEHIDVLAIVPQSTRPERLPESVTVFLDGERILHDHFGCGSEALYLIRPDGYVGFRSQPADADALSRYLESIFVG
jgi:2-polyprenyl-6-methoxyphenol hydroxylase-like FAD-dependent oxidoreductase